MRGSWARGSRAAPGITMSTRMMMIGTRTCRFALSYCAPVRCIIPLHRSYDRFGTGPCYAEFRVVPTCQPEKLAILRVHHLQYHLVSSLVLQQGAAYRSGRGDA